MCLHVCPMLYCPPGGAESLGLFWMRAWLWHDLPACIAALARGMCAGRLPDQLG